MERKFIVEFKNHVASTREITRLLQWSKTSIGPPSFLDDPYAESEYHLLMPDGLDWDPTGDAFTIVSCNCAAFVGQGIIGVAPVELLYCPRTAGRLEPIVDPTAPGRMVALKMHGVRQFGSIAFLEERYPNIANSFKPSRPDELYAPALSPDIVF